MESISNESEIYLEEIQKDLFNEIAFNLPKDQKQLYGENTANLLFRLFKQKNYMSKENCLNSNIINILCKEHYYFTECLHIEITNILNILALLTNIHSSNVYFRLPDKMIAKLLNSNRQNVHLLFFKLKEILVDYLSISFNKNNSYLSLKINRERLFNDPLLKEICIHRQSSDRRIKNIWYGGIKKPYYNETYCNITARVNFKRTVMGLMYYYSDLTEELRIPKDLAYFRNEVGYRTDIKYLELPIVMLCKLTGLTGKEIMSRMTTWCNSCNYIKQHKVTYNTYYDSEYRKSSTVNIKNKLEGYPSTSFSFILINDKFNNTKLANYIFNNEDVYKFIIKKYLKFNEINIQNLKQDIFKYNIVGDVYETPLNVMQLCEVNKKLDHINIQNLELSYKAKKLLNKDKIYSLPKKKTKLFKIFAYIHCFENKNEKKNLLLNIENKPILKSVNKCVYVLAKIVEQIEDKNNLTKISDLSHYLKNYNQVFNYVKTGFTQTGKNLKDFIKLIQKYNLGNHFSKVPEAIPYLNQII